MKGQWFGDINDYFKYGLLRLVAENTGLSIGVCWMLTAGDERIERGRQSSRFKYLSRPATWRACDPKLYDFLRHEVIDCDTRDVARIENRSILPACRFHSAVLGDDADARRQYFTEMRRALRDCDLLFFDADNGMQVKSKPYGRKHSSRYLYWCEAKELYRTGYSLLVFQYHRRVKYEDFIKCLTKEFADNIGVEPQYFYRTRNVTLILLAQKKHRTLFRKATEAIHAGSWGDQTTVFPAHWR